MLFVVAAALFLIREELGLSVVFLTLAALTRETMLLAAVGAIAYVWHEKRSVPKVSRPCHSWLAPFGGCMCDCNWVISTTSVQDTAGAWGCPSKASTKRSSSGSSQPDSEVDLIMGIVLLVVSILVAIRAVTERSLLGLMGGRLRSSCCPDGRGSVAILFRRLACPGSGDHHLHPHRRVTPGTEAPTGASRGACKSAQWLISELELRAVVHVEVTSNDRMRGCFPRRSCVSLGIASHHARCQPRVDWCQCGLVIADWFSLSLAPSVNFHRPMVPKCRWAAATSLVMLLGLVGPPIGTYPSFDRRHPRPV